MAGKPKARADVESLSFGRLDAYRRSTWYQDAKTTIQIVLMWTFTLGVITLLVLTVAVGIFEGHYFLDTPGTQALSKLFTEITANVKTLALIALGFFFREYLNGAESAK